ncbi:unnamed protein product [Cuscuta europaea]|uniref:Uncharacterized protein n=1 Tax=Cuscuta europaea TaxID=41803 RepID=A0A9P0YIF8_CUSEU|nr:unnamed protein product [Cuscuta europaea]
MDGLPPPHYFQVKTKEESLLLPPSIHLDPIYPIGIERSAKYLPPYPKTSSSNRNQKRGFREGKVKESVERLRGLTEVFLEFAGVRRRFAGVSPEFN